MFTTQIAMNGKAKLSESVLVPNSLCKTNVDSKDNFGLSKFTMTVEIMIVNRSLHFRLWTLQLLHMEHQ